MDPHLIHMILIDCINAYVAISVNERNWKSFEKKKMSYSKAKTDTWWINGCCENKQQKIDFTIKHYFGIFGKSFEKAKKHQNCVCLLLQKIAQCRRPMDKRTKKEKDLLWEIFYLWTIDSLCQATLLTYWNP